MSHRARRHAHPTHEEAPTPASGLPVRYGWKGANQTSRPCTLSTPGNAAHFEDRATLKKRPHTSRAAVSEVLPSQPLTLCFSAEGALLLGSLVQINARLRRQERHARRTDQALDQHPFVARLLQHIDLNADDLKTFEALIVNEVTVSRRRDLTVDGYEYRKLSFIRDGYAVRYKLLRNGKRQILNVLLPGDIVGIPGSFLERAVYSVTAITDVTMNVCSLDSYVQLCYRRPQFGLALTWIAVQEAAIYAEHIIDVGRRTPVERLSHFLLELHERLHAIGRADKTGFALSFSQEVMADVLGMSVPHLNRMMQRLRSEKLIAGSERRVEFGDLGALQSLAHYQPQTLTPVPTPVTA